MYVPHLAATVGAVMKAVFGLLLVAASCAPLAAAGEPAVSAESLDNFLSGVRDFAGGKLTPGPLYDPQAAGLPAGGGAIATIGTASTMNYFNTGRPASWRTANGGLAGGSLVRSSIANQPLIGQSMVRLSPGRHR